MDISAVVVAVPSHKDYLKDVIADCLSQTLPYNQVILVLSGFNPSQILEVKSENTDSWSSSVEVHVRPMAPAGANRNFGYSLAQHDYVSFLDADDRYPIWRNEVFSQLQSHFNMDLFLHSYATFDSGGGPVLLRPSNALSSCLGTEALLELNFPLGRNRWKELAGAPTALQHERSGLHHGHLYARNGLLSDQLSFHTYSWPRNEDSLFVRDCLWRGHKVVASSDVMSSYRTSSTSANRQNKMWLHLPKLLYFHLRSQFPFAWKKEFDR